VFVCHGEWLRTSIREEGVGGVGFFSGSAPMVHMCITINVQTLLVFMLHMHTFMVRIPVCLALSVVANGVDQKAE